MAGLEQLLQAQLVSGGLIEGVKLVRVGDHQPLETRQLPAVTIDFERDLAPPTGRAPGSRLEHTWELAVTLYCYDGRHQGQSQAALRSHWLRREAGQDKGLKIALLKIQKVTAPDGTVFIFRLGETRAGGLRQDGGHYTAASISRVTVTTWGSIPTP